jgi:hypothetical protein
MFLRTECIIALRLVFLCVGSLSQFRIATATERQGKRGKKKERELVVADNQDGIPDRNHF